MAIKVFEGLEFLNEGLVLIFKHSHTIFKTFDIFFLLPATLPGSFPGTNTRQMTTGTTSQHNPEWLREHLPPPYPVNSQQVWGKLNKATQQKEQSRCLGENNRPNEEHG